MGDSKKTIRFSKKTIRFRNDNDGNVYSRSGVSSDPINRRAAVQIVHDRRFVSTMPPSLRIECSEQRVLKGAVLLGLAQVVVHPVLLSASCPPRFDSSLRQSYADKGGCKQRGGNRC